MLEDIWTTTLYMIICYTAIMLPLSNFQMKLNVSIELYCIHQSVSLFIFMPASCGTVQYKHFNPRHIADCAEGFANKSEITEVPIGIDGLVVDEELFQNMYFQ